MKISLYIGGKSERIVVTLSGTSVQTERSVSTSCEALSPVFEKDLDPKLVRQ